MSTTPRRLPRWAVTLAVAGILTVLASGTAVAVAVSAPAPQPVCVPGTMSADGRFVIDCQVPLPSASTVTVTTPVPTTVTETVTLPAPTTSSSPPTTTPAPTTPAPSPSTSSPAGGCMAKPSACGWPDETNTGVPAGTVLTVHQGNLTIRTAGTVIDGMDIRGCVFVEARNVTIRRSRVTCGGFHGIVARPGGNYEDPQAGLLVEDVELHMKSFNMKGISFQGYTARRVWFHGGADCAAVGRNVTIVDSFCDIPAGGAADGPHYDGIEDAGARDVIIRHNTVRVPYGQTSPINMDDADRVAIVDNLVAGGGYAIYCPNRGGGTMTAFSGNVIAKTYFAKGGYWGPVTGCPSSGWRWDG